MNKVVFSLLVLSQSLLLVLASPETEKSDNNKSNSNRPENTPTQRKIKQEPDPKPLNKAEVVKEEVKAKVVERNLNSTGRCIPLKNMMTKRIQLLEENLGKRQRLLSKINNSLTTKIQTLKLSGVDTSQVELSLSKFIKESESLILQREQLILTLKDLSSFDCESNPSSLQSSLREFNQKFKNQNLEFNRLSRDFRVTVLYEISNLAQSLESKDE